MIRLQARLVVDDSVISRTDCTLSNVLTDQVEVIPGWLRKKGSQDTHHHENTSALPLSDSVVHNNPRGRVSITITAAAKHPGGDTLLHHNHSQPGAIVLSCIQEEYRSGQPNHHFSAFKRLVVHGRSFIYICGQLWHIQPSQHSTCNPLLE